MLRANSDQYQTHPSQLLTAIRDRQAKSFSGGITLPTQDVVSSSPPKPKTTSDTADNALPRLVTPSAAAAVVPTRYYPAAANVPGRVPIQARRERSFSGFELSGGTTETKSPKAPTVRRNRTTTGSGELSCGESPKLPSILRRRASIVGGDAMATMGKPPGGDESPKPSFRRRRAATVNGDDALPGNKGDRLSGGESPKPPWSIQRRRASIVGGDAMATTGKSPGGDESPNPSFRRRRAATVNGDDALPGKGDRLSGGDPKPPSIRRRRASIVTTYDVPPAGSTLSGLSSPSRATLASAGRKPQDDSEVAVKTPMMMRRRGTTRTATGCTASGSIANDDETTERAISSLGPSVNFGAISNRRHSFDDTSDSEKSSRSPLVIRIPAQTLHKPAGRLHKNGPYHIIST